MNDKAFDVIANSIVFVFVYGLFGGLYSGLLLLPVPDSGGRLVLASIYGLYSAGVGIWSIIKANKADDAEMRRLSATVSLAFIALFVTCGFALLMSDTLLQSDMLWLFLKGCLVTVAAIIVAAIVMFAVFAFQQD